RSVGGARDRQWLYLDALRPLVELDGAGTVRRVFVYGTGRVPDLMIIPAGVAGAGTSRIPPDWRGSVRRVVNVANGDVAQEIGYDSFGRVLSDSAPGFQPFGFAGGHYDERTGLVRFGARDYDSETGRWTAPDPIRFAAGDTNL